MTSEGKGRNLIEKKRISVTHTSRTTWSTHKYHSSLFLFIRPRVDVNFNCELTGNPLRTSHTQAILKSDLLTPHMDLVGSVTFLIHGCSKYFVSRSKNFTDKETFHFIKIKPSIRFIKKLFIFVWRILGSWVNQRLTGKSTAEPISQPPMIWNLTYAKVLKDG